MSFAIARVIAGIPTTAGIMDRIALGIITRTIGISIAIGKQIITIVGANITKAAATGAVVSGFNFS
jgi:hypothetical protein